MKVETENKKLTIEVEHSSGDTLLCFEIDISNPTKPQFLRTGGCDIADVDNDYIFESDNTLVRVQAE